MKTFSILHARSKCLVLISTLASAILVANASDAAVVASVDWDNADASADGVITGMLGAVSVTLTTGPTTDFSGDPDGAVNGGVFLPGGTDWSTNVGSNDVPGISDPGIFNEAAIIDMGISNSLGRTVISFSQPVTNPTILINFISNRDIGFYFDPTMPLLTLVDNVGSGTFGIPIGVNDGTLGPANSLFINSTVGNSTKDDGFAVRLTGTFSEIRFDTEEGNSAANEGTVALTVVAAIPEPSSFSLVLLSTLGLTLMRRRDR